MLDPAVPPGTPHLRSGRGVRAPLKRGGGSTHPPPKEHWAMARVHEWQAVQSAGRNVARQWPTGPQE